MADSIRPITIQPTIGKFYEMLHKHRVEQQLHITKLFSDNHHGFKIGRSKSTAIKSLRQKMDQARKKKILILITIDFKSILDTIEWSHTINNPRDTADKSLAAICRLLLSNRVAIYDNRRKGIVRTLETGCPQGGPGSPIIWNISLNDFLLEFEHFGVPLVAVADDTALVVSDDLQSRFEPKIKQALDLLQRWSARSDVQVNSSKSTYTWLGKTSIREATLIYRSEQISEANEIKYLCVYIEPSMN